MLPFTSIRGVVPLAAVLVAVSGEARWAAGQQFSAENLPWAGHGAFRLRAQLPARPRAGRPRDELPAELAVDFAAELRKLGVDRTVDIASLQVIRHDRETGRPSPGTNYAYARGPFDLPFRWYDAAIPYEFPDMLGAVSSSQEKLFLRPRTRGGYFFNAVGDWQTGRLAWMHTQVDDEPAHYAIYFDLLPTGKSPSALPPAAWIGDGTPRYDQIGGSTTGADHARLELDDWNDDGLVDLIVGEQTGHIFWWPNMGTRQRPEYRFAKFLFADGQPLDAGQAAAPKVVDWDGDGRKDLLAGTHWNRILFFRNTGTNRERKLEYCGPVTIDGQPLELPVGPLTRGSPDVFKRDYYPVLETVDWDGDGDLDLLAGGYITGMIFYYENQGRDDDGTPRLRLHGPLEADGAPINVKYWCAAPCAADFDGDGDLDLFSGTFPMYVRASDGERPEFLRYYDNVGSRNQPRLASRPLPGSGAMPHPRLATPRAADWDGDGDLDLAVSSGQDIFLFENRGTPARPEFSFHAEPLKTPWGQAPIWADRFLDFNGDGRVDVASGYTVRLNAGVGNPFAWKETVSILPRGQHIAHPSGIGDDWFFPYPDDFDGDGKIDILFGDWWGHVWLHRNLTEGEEKRFDLTGLRLQLATGELIKVGPLHMDPAKSFDALQGARTVLAVADFDRDSRRDLVVGDTYGKIRYFRNLGPRAGGREPVFANAVEIANLGTRGLVDAADWNADGWPDVVASSANGRVRVLLNQQKKSEQPFAEGFDPGLPPIMQPRVLMADINGDGDDDLYLPSIQGSCFIERSFLEQGYARAELVTLQQKRP